MYKLATTVRARMNVRYIVRTERGRVQALTRLVSHQPTAVSTRGICDLKLFPAKVKKMESQSQHKQPSRSNV
eukprot:1643128-Pleurochrysis_carterae.AAC.1